VSRCTTVTWRELLAEAARRLRSAGSASPEVDARRIVETASGSDGAAFLLALEEAATQRGVVHFDAMLARRLGGEPLQYVLGRWGFRTLDLMVDHRVLIPRPETEQVVSEALVELDALQRSRSDGRSKPTAMTAPAGERGCHPALRVVDLGCGSGAIGLSIAVERPGVDVWCVDLAPGAVAVTRANLAGLGMAGGRVTVVEGRWFEPLPASLRGSVDLVVTNPPYVAGTDDLPREVADWEPPEALIPGPTGREAIDQITAAAPTWLAPDGVLVVEIGATQGSDAKGAAQRAGFGEVDVRTDLLACDRMLVARTR